MSELVKSENSTSNQFYSNQKNAILKAKELLIERYKEHIPLAYIHSYGCQQNISDGEKLKGILAEIGYGFTDNVDDSDLVLYNTCAVREHAQDRVFGNVGALKNVKRRKPSMHIVLCGCMMQQDHVVERIKKSYPFVDLVFGTQALYRLPEILVEKLEGTHPIYDIQSENDIITEGVPVKRDGGIKAWLPIMYGCDNFCSYCVVPYVRGRERSRSLDSVLNEVKQIVGEGYKEITLLGQNVNSYGKGLKEQLNFSALLKRINEVEGDFQIRFMSSHPKDVTFELIDTIFECEKVCNQLHLPVQSGNDRILKLMNRKYDTQRYLELIGYAKQKIPDLGLSSDIIVGFPSETYEEFLDTLHLVEKIRFNNLYTFIYSKRKNTAAENMVDTISAEEKSKWFRELLSVQEQISFENNLSMIGKIKKVLIDGIGKSGDGFISGRSEDNTIVETKGDRSQIGNFVDIKIESAKNWAVIGKLV